MTTPADWQKTNEAYLVAALAWLRLRLERLAAHQPSAPALPLPPALPAKKAEKHDFFLIRWLRRLFGEAAVDDKEISIAPALVLSPATDAVSDDEIAKAETAMTAAEQSEMPPALAILSQRFKLSRFEQQ